jgi:hypothetical protein
METGIKKKDYWKLFFKKSSPRNNIKDGSFNIIVRFGFQTYTPLSPPSSKYLPSLKNILSHYRCRIEMSILYKKFHQAF